MAKLHKCYLLLLGSAIVCQGFLPATTEIQPLSSKSRTLKPAMLPHVLVHSPKRSLTRRELSLEPILSTAQQVAASLFQFNGPVPLLQAFGINVFLFTLLREKLLTSLTPQGFFHAMALGTGLWTTLGWRGWTLCVLYLALGQIGKSIVSAKCQR